MTHIPAPPTHIEFAGISKAYPNGVQALQDIDLTIRQGEIFGIIGRSGAGKSTLLRLFNRLENADSGEMFIHGESTVRYSTRQLRDLRRRVAMIFQHFNLMATKTVAQNIALPLKMAGVPAGERQRRVSVLEGGRIVEQGDVWRVFGNPQHPVTRAMLGLQHPDRPEAGPALRDGEQIVTLRFDGSSGREPNLQHIASLLGGDARLLYSNCERIQGRVIGQLQVRLSGPLAASALAQDGWVADSILTHHHQTAETTAS
ncbi:ABC transporter [Klebsiella variicola]|uniref:ATP-binding cassette domain-containing protein n=1 Tax=Klebsiella variicola TaxID=244366 RepID=UPI000D745C3C|nr:ATP-binding cassette domain-containing protein [Klebsiella variicola]PXK08109.1 ABC transporter [Klebsiella variicola]